MCYVEKCIRIIILLMFFQQFGESAWLRCYKGSLEKYVLVALEDIPPSFIACIDKNVPTVVYTFGYRGRVDGPATTAVVSAYIATKKRNVILLDWEDEAKSGVLGIPLGYALYAVPNARKIGKKLGDALVSLANAGVNMTNIHLVGHSLGAHVMAYAGRETRKQGHVVLRITGLDPARALFEGTLAIQSGLDRTCARFVDIVHTDPGGYGTSKSTGTVDFWPNYKGEKSTQPGCKDGEFEMFSPDDLCSHDCAWRYFTEALSSPTTFPAVSAPDFDAWTSQSFDTKETIFLGDLVNIRAKGNYYLTTNSEPPYGRGIKGIEPNQTQTRTTRESTISRWLKYLR